MEVFKHSRVPVSGLVLRSVYHPAEGGQIKADSRQENRQEAYKDKRA